MSKLRVGVDIGGTFTDLVVAWPDGRLDRRKVPSTPHDYAQAIVEGLRTYGAAEGLSLSEIDEIVHATTVATNAILERKGAKTALLATEGFRDVLELRRIRIPMSYDLGWEKPVPLVERALRFAIGERIGADGTVLRPLEEAGVHAAAAAIAAEGVEAVAVCFLHSYGSADHEQRAAAILRKHLPGVYISVSSEVLPEMREFERTSTTVVNAYVGPLIGRYLGTLRLSLARHSVDAPVLVMQSNGGLISAGAAAVRPVTIIESGPAAGVVAGCRLAKTCGYSDVITLDMGGTTTKASIIEQGEILRGSEYEVGSSASVSSRLMRGSGYLIRIPVIDVCEVGAGGGSIAAIDAGGALRVGPRSAGAMPGPACYGQGNEYPTVTDANLVLGFINPDSLAGGALDVDRQLAEQAIGRYISKLSGLALLDAAHGIHVVANSNMVRAIKSVSVERGRDPSHFHLLAFGGAGPIHAAGVAGALGMRRVLVPPAAGVFSAFGLLRAEAEHHAARSTLVATAGADLGRLRSAVAEMRTDLLGRLLEEGYTEGIASFHGAADLRYRGQSSELTVEIDLDNLSTDELEKAVARFEMEFEKTFGHLGRQREFELVTLRMVMKIARRVEHGEAWRGETQSRKRESARKIYLGRDLGLVDARVVARRDLAPAAIRGPCLVEEYDTTIVVPLDWTASLDEWGNVLMENT
jgi:N-methylhydantoinase A